VKRTTLELDEELLARAKRALGQQTARATVEEALRQAAEAAEDDRSKRATRQREYLTTLSSKVDTAVLAAGEMWR
jgi:Arc/MetJ family transcription regulator